MFNKYKPKDNDYDRAAIALNNIGFKKNISFDLAPVYFKGVGRADIENVSTNDIIYLLKNKPKNGFTLPNLKKLNEKGKLNNLISCFGECCDPLSAYACGIKNGIQSQIAFEPYRHDIILANTIGAIFGKMSKKELINTKKMFYESVLDGGIKEPIRNLYLEQFKEHPDEVRELNGETPRYTLLEESIFRAITRNTPDESFITDINQISRGIFPIFDNDN